VTAGDRIVGKVDALSFAPVKGMRLVQPESVQLGPNGIDGDRRFQVCDAETLRGRAAKDSRLGRIAASWDPSTEELSLTFPSGRVAAGRVELGGPKAVIRAWDGASLPGREVRGPWSEALSEELGKDLLLVRNETPEGANDVAPITFLSLDSVRRLARELGVEDIDRERFRMTMIASGPGEHEEDEWYGRELDVGGARIRILGPVPRCAVTTRKPGTGKRDLDVVRALVQYRGKIWSPYEKEDADAPLGVYAQTVTPGPAGVGDEIRLAA
jgi:uncharacterized protein